MQTTNKLNRWGVLKMGVNLCWTGVAMIAMSMELGLGSIIGMAGAVILIIGAVLNWMGK